MISPGAPNDAAIGRAFKSCTGNSLRL